VQRNPRVPAKFAHLDIGDNCRIDESVEINARTSEISIGDFTQIAGPADFNAIGSSIIIGDGCDIAALVTINCADSHKKVIGLAPNIERLPIVIGDRVFIGQGATILGGCTIGHHTVIGAGAIIKGEDIIPFSRVRPQLAIIEPGFYILSSSSS